MMLRQRLGPRVELRLRNGDGSWTMAVPPTEQASVLDYAFGVADRRGARRCTIYVNRRPVWRWRASADRLLQLDAAGLHILVSDEGTGGVGAAMSEIEVIGADWHGCVFGRLSASQVTRLRRWLTSWEKRHAAREKRHAARTRPTCPEARRGTP